MGAHGREPADDAPIEWREFRPRPARRSLAAVLASLLWAPRRNETLFLLSCAARIVEERSVAAERRLVAARRTSELLLATGIALLARDDGPYNGGSDRMCLLLLTGLWLAHVAPIPAMRGAALGYVAVQLVASYLLAGVAKAANPAWRDGGALRDVFAFSIYPVSEDLRALARRPRLLTALGWGVLLFELAFPLALLDARLLTCALALAFVFHLVIAALFGLDRFVWAWLAAYPLLAWFQATWIAPLLGRHQQRQRAGAPRRTPRLPLPARWPIVAATGSRPNPTIRRSLP